MSGSSAAEPDLTWEAAVAERSNEDRIAQLEALVANQQRTIDGLLEDRTRPAPIPAPPGVHDAPVATTGAVSRRHLLRRAGVAAAGAVGGAAVLQAAAASPAAATNGDPLLAGATTTSTTETILSCNTDVVSANVLTVADSSSVWTSAHPAAVGGYGSGHVANGVYGFTSTNDGAGVVGYASAVNGIGVLARSLSGPDLLLAPYGPPPRDRGAVQMKGELHVDDDGNLWFCTQTGTPGQWRKLAGQSTAGALHMMSPPYRIYDSRPGNPPDGGIETPFANHEQRTISIHRDGILSGVTPRAVLVNLTATNTNPGGYFAVFQAGIPWPNNSSLNWAQPNTTVANMQVVAVDAGGDFIARCEGAGGADLVVDLIGYFE